METRGGSGPGKSPFREPRKTNLGPVLRVFGIVVLCARDRVLRVLRIPSFDQAVPVLFDDPHHFAVDALEPSAGRHEQLFVSKPETPLLLVMHDRNVGWFDSFLLPDLHLPAPSLELLRE